MAVIFNKAPGKIIIFGEHAVVYGQPAIAIPVSRVKATVRIFPNFDVPDGTIRIQAEDIDLDVELSELPDQHPLASAVDLTINAIQAEHIPSIRIQIASSIPISAGMGSSAATSIALIGALSSFLGNPLPTSIISSLAFEVEKIHHGTPSGIDNSVIAYNMPIYYVKNEPIEFLNINQPTHWVIADTGEKTPTHETVSAVRTMHTINPKKIGSILEKIGEITRNARIPLIEGNLLALGELLDENQGLLSDLNLSSDKLDNLINVAKSAGAYGAKLSGGGRGGNMIAIAPPEKIESISTSLKAAGAARVITTRLAEFEGE